MNTLQLEKIAGEVGGLDVGQGAQGLAGEARVAREMASQGLDSSSSGAAPGKSFADMLQNSMASVNADQQQADRAIKELIAGRSKNIHETMLTIEKADSSLKLMMQVRNKVLDAYREIMRMQV